MPTYAIYIHIWWKRQTNVLPCGRILSFPRNLYEWGGGEGGIGGEKNSHFYTHFKFWFKHLSQKTFWQETHISQLPLREQVAIYFIISFATKYFLGKLPGKFITTKDKITFWWNSHIYKPRSDIVRIKYNSQMPNSVHVSPRPLNLSPKETFVEWIIRHQGSIWTNWGCKVCPVHLSFSDAKSIWIRLVLYCWGHLRSFRTYEPVPPGSLQEA